MEPSTLIRKSKQSLERFKMLAEEMEVQLALGKAEARDAFKREQKNLSDYLRKQKEAIVQSERIKEAHRGEFALQFEKLEGMLNVEVPTGKRTYDKYKKEVLASITQLEYLISEHTDEVDDFMEGNLDQFKALLDAYRIQLALSGTETIDRPEQRKADLKKKVTEIRTMLQDEKEDEDKLETFVEEVSASFNHLKKAFADLLD